jgi:hypothetical protein
MEGKLGYDIDYLMPIKLIYLVRNELTLIKLKLCSLSRVIGFPYRARIIEFGSKVRGQCYNILGWRFEI